MNKYQYSITLDPKRHLVLVVAQGELVRAEGQQIVIKSLAIAAEQQYDIFCDVRQALVKVSLVDWFYMPRTLKIFRNEKVRAIRTAVLIAPGKQEEDYKFYETVVYNLGMSLKVFITEKDALEWLAAGS